MKSKEQYMVFIKEVKALCDRHEIGMVGTCNKEGIIGEITLFDLVDGHDQDEYNFEYTCSSTHSFSSTSN